MKKKILYGLAVALIAVVATVNVQIAASNKGEASDLMLENVEAILNAETSDEFTAATGCVACWDNHSCTSRNGSIYSYAHRK